MSICRRFALCVWLILSPLVAHADVVLDWNARMFTTITGQTPLGTARLAAITQLAVFEAVNAITKTYEPYLGTIDAPEGASAEAAAAAAAHAVLKHYFPAQAVPLGVALEASLSAIPDGPAKQDGVATGVAAALAMIALRANDGSAPSMPPTFYVPPSDPGQWQRTRLYGPRGHDITFSSTLMPEMTLVTLHYTTFKRIIEDISDARVYGGIHFSVRPG